MHNDKNNNKRSETIQYYFDTKEYCLIPKGLKQHLRQSKLSSGARDCFDLLLEEVTYSDDWSTQIPRCDIAEKLLKTPNTVSKLLQELEKAGYIIRKLNPSKASTIYINLPKDAIAALEISNTRRTKKAIKKCGTIVEKPKSKIENSEDVSNFRSPQKREGDLLKNDSPTLYNTKQYNINNNTDLASDRESAFSNELVVGFLSDHDKLASNGEQITEIQQDVSFSETDKLLKDASITANEQRIQALEHELMPLQQKLKTLCVADKANFYDVHMLLLDKELHELRHSAETLVLTDVQCKFEAGVVAKAELRQQQLKTLEAELSLLKLVESESHCSQMQDEKTKYAMVAIERNRLRMGDVELEIKRLSDIDRKVERIKRNDYLHSKGQRKLSDKLRIDLQRNVRKIIGTDDEEKIFEIANQISYEVRFGSLRASKENRQTISEQHGVNIALLILRKGDWTKPAGMLRVA